MNKYFYCIRILLSFPKRGLDILVGGWQRLLITHLETKLLVIIKYNPIKIYKSVCTISDDRT